MCVDCVLPLWALMTDRRSTTQNVRVVTIVKSGMRREQTLRRDTDYINKDPAPLHHHRRVPGRGLMEGRRYSEGACTRHARPGGRQSPALRNQTLASITFQPSFSRLYPNNWPLWMTARAMTECNEFADIYSARSSLFGSRPTAAVLRATYR